MMSLRPDGTHTEAELQKERETLEACGMFEEADLETKINPDGTITVTIPFVESTWEPTDGFRCINVGLMPDSNPIKMDPDMTEKERLKWLRDRDEWYSNQEMEPYKSRIERVRPCLLPDKVQKEISLMLRDQGKVRARLLRRIRDRVEQWYKDNGYGCAQVLNSGSLNTKKLVCEVVEGDIMQLITQFHDKHGNACEGNTQMAVIKERIIKAASPRSL